MKAFAYSAYLSLVLLAVSVLLTATANANPTGFAVVNGTATVQPSGNLLQITNSPNAIINWQSFSIGVNEITRFVQQSASSAVLNRVVAQNPSAVLGALQSNGRVFLINPSGILFGAGAKVDVAGLVASTLNLSDADFLTGRLRFAETPGAGAVVNQGAINAAGGGVYLVGSSVTNGGVISNPQGEVILAAGRSVELVNPGTANLRVEINAPDNEALNLGQIIAASGRIGIFAGLIRNSGTLNADRAVLGPAGEIVLKATTDIVMDGGASISAVDGTLRIEAGGSVTLIGPGGVTGGDIFVNSTGNVSIDQGATVAAANGTITIQTGGDLNGSGVISTGGQVTIAAPGTGNLTLGGGTISPTGVITSGSGSVMVNGISPSLTAGGGTISPTGVITSGSGSVTVNGGSLTVSGGTPPAPAIVISSGSGSVTVNGTNVPLGSGQPGASTTHGVSVLLSPGQARPVVADFAASTGAARGFQLGIGQLVGSLLSTSRINHPAWILDGSASRLFPPPRSGLISE